MSNGTPGLTGPVGVKPIKTHAITAWQQLMHSMIVTDPPILRRAKHVAHASRRKRGR